MLTVHGRDTVNFQKFLSGHETHDHFKEHFLVPCGVWNIASPVFADNELPTSRTYILVILLDSRGLPD